MDTVAHNLYGPKLSGGWGVPIALQGPAGTANVQYTPWVNPEVWSQDSTTGNWVHSYFTQPIPALTANVLNSGAVFCFANLGVFISSVWPTGQIVQLPYTFNVPYNGTAWTTYWDCVYDTAQATVNVNDPLGILTASELNSSGGPVSVRWIIIPGGTSIPAGMDYEQTMKYLGVQFKP
jgi:hypothetical protein